MVVAAVLTMAHLQTQRSFYYSIPAAILSEIKVGSLVRVPLRSRIVDGIVIKLTRSSRVGQLKPIKKLELTAAVDRQTLALAKFLSDNYLGEMGECLNAILPS